MKIKIEDTEKSRTTIEKALAAVNRGATAHTYTDAYEIVSIAERAEKRLTALGLTKGARPGAVAYETSGSAVAKSYKYPRAATYVQVTRGASAWFVTDVHADLIWADGGGPLHAVATPEQDEQIVAIAMRNLRSRYQVQYKALVKADAQVA
jgi:hypothetical protein